MFNREYQKRATRQGLAARTVREAGGGHQVAKDAALRLPWAGIFEPWRPLVLTAAAAAKANSVKNAVKRCKKSSQRLLFDGKLRGVQLAFAFEPDEEDEPLFPEDDGPDNTAQKFTVSGNFTVPNDRESPADSSFPPLSEMVNPMAVLSDEDLAEIDKLFPL